MDCIIREWRIGDKINLAKMLNNRHILDNLRDGLPYPYTVDDAEEYITAMLAANKTKTFAFAITLNDVVIGSIGAFRRDNIHYKTAELGYYIGEEHWGQGYGTSAVIQACSYVFENTDIIRIFAEPFAHNIASCRILEKAGFQFEGTLHSNAVKNEQVVDMKMYALVKV
ncbi:MAG TPA: GNAT family N-acetyltransferase [Treponemataceae bacterium]|nr:GNAT family N-acetyltransferase [Treponemataceae bacterium]